MAYMIITKHTSRPICKSGTIARNIEFITTCRPEKREKLCQPYIHIISQVTVASVVFLSCLLSISGKAVLGRSKAINHLMGQSQPFFQMKACASGLFGEGLHIA